MKTSTEKALDRLLRKMSRPPRVRRGRLSTAPITLALGLILGYQLLVRVVPRLWSELLPGGLDQAALLRGWPGLVWRLAVDCHQNFSTALTAAILVVCGAFFVCAAARPLRFLVWLAALGVILLDAGIVYVAVRTAAEATARASGMF